MSITKKPSLKTIPAFQVTKGMTVHLEGARFIVEQSTYDRHGAGPNRPQQLLIASAHPDERMGTAHATNQHFGLAPSSLVKVVA